MLTNYFQPYNARINYKYQDAYAASIVQFLNRTCSLTPTILHTNENSAILQAYGSTDTRGKKKKTAFYPVNLKGKIFKTRKEVGGNYLKHSVTAAQQSSEEGVAKGTGMGHTARSITYCTQLASSHLQFWLPLSSTHASQLIPSK